MKQLKASSVLLAMLLAVGLLAGCATSNSNLTPQQQIYSQYGKILTDAAGIYEATMQAAGQAHAMGLLQTADLTRVEAVGAKVQVALTTAKSSLKIYLSSPTPATSGQGAVVNDLILVQQVLTELLQVSQQLGLNKPLPVNKP